MPPRDPRKCPALERAMPADDVKAPVRITRTLWEIVFGDGEWRPATVRAHRTDRYGREVIDVEWHIDASTWNESYIADPQKMRQPVG